MSDPTSPPVENPTGSEPAGAGEAPLEKCVIVRYGRMAQTGLFRHNLETAPAPGCMLVVRSERGVELGKVLTGLGDSSCPSYPRCINHDRLEDYLRANGPDYPFTRDGRVMRLATPQDLNEQQHLDRSGDEHATYCDQHIRQLGLDMKIVCVEHLLGGERIIFYFIASQRVDFRDLVKRLASQYHTRIEMRQVGARDEARLVADYERCGQRCCCQEYLKFLKPVSMRMAKMQKATLDPTKISGRCGRLMCCLRYEDETYEQLQAKLPRKGTWVRTGEAQVGRVLEGQVLTQLVRLLLTDGTLAVVANERIVERNIPEPAGQLAPQPRRAMRPAERAQQAAAQQEAAHAQAQARADEDMAERARQNADARSPDTQEAPPPIQDQPQAAPEPEPEVAQEHPQPPPAAEMPDETPLDQAVQPVQERQPAEGQGQVQGQDQGQGQRQDQGRGQRQDQGQGQRQDQGRGQRQDQGQGQGQGRRHRRRHRGRREEMPGQPSPRGSQGPNPDQPAQGTGQSTPAGLSPQGQSAGPPQGPGQNQGQGRHRRRRHRGRDRSGPLGGNPQGQGGNGGNSPPPPPN